MKYRGREPVHAKELNFMRRCIGWAMTVSKDDAVGSIQVEDHMVTEIGGTGALAALTMTELNDLTKGGKSSCLEEHTGPFLISTVSGRNNQFTRDAPRVNGVEVLWSWTMCTGGRLPKALQASLTHRADYESPRIEVDDRDHKGTRSEIEIEERTPVTEYLKS